MGSISVPCFRIEAEHGKEFAQYRVDSPAHGSVWRRYREFAALAGALQGLPASARCPKKSLPYLTGRMVRNPLAEENLEKRRGKLAVYLNEVAALAATFPAIKGVLDAFLSGQDGDLSPSSTQSSTRPMVLTADSSDIMKDAAHLLAEDASSLALLPKCRTCGKTVTPVEAGGEGGAEGKEGSAGAAVPSASSSSGGGAGSEPVVSYDTRAFCSVQCQRFFDAMQSKGFTISFVEGTRQIIPTPAPRASVVVAPVERRSSSGTLPTSPSLRAVSVATTKAEGSPKAGGDHSSLHDLPSLEALEADPSHGNANSVRLSTAATSAPAPAPASHPFGRTKRPAGTGILAVFKQGGALGFGKSSTRMPAGIKDVIAEEERDSDADGEDAPAAPAAPAPPAAAASAATVSTSAAPEVPALTPLTGILAYCPVTNAVRTAAHQRAVKAAAASAGVVFSGEAWKRGAGLKNWKLRRFELRDRSLYYYRTSKVKLLGKLHMYVSPAPHALLAAASALVDKGYDPSAPSFDALLFAVPYDDCFFAQVSDVPPAEADKLGLPSQLMGKRGVVAVPQAPAAGGSGGAPAPLAPGSGAASVRLVVPSTTAVPVTSTPVTTVPFHATSDAGPWVLCLSTPERTLYLSFEKAETHAEWHRVLTDFVEAERQRLLGIVRGHFQQMTRPFSERLELALASPDVSSGHGSGHRLGHHFAPHAHHRLSLAQHLHGITLGDGGEAAPESPLLSESERAGMSLSRIGGSRGMPSSHRGSATSFSAGDDAGAGSAMSLAGLDDAVAAAARAAAAMAVGLTSSSGSSGVSGSSVGFPITSARSAVTSLSPAALGLPALVEEGTSAAREAQRSGSVLSGGLGAQAGGATAPPSPAADRPGADAGTLPTTPAGSSAARPALETPLQLQGPHPADLPDALHTAALAASLVSPVPSMSMPSASRGLSQAAASIAAASSRSFVKAGSFSGVTALQHALGVHVNAWEISEEEIEVVDRIGSGSFGDVYRGRLFGTEVAVKLLTSPTAVSTEALDSLKTEVAILSSLRHPNVVLYLGAQTTPPNIFIVTEWCERGSLSSLLYDRTVPLSAAARLGMALQTAQGMCYLHAPRRKIIHRDLKSSNLLVTRDFTVKVADFGLTIMRNQGIKGNRGGDAAAKALGTAAGGGGAQGGARGITPSSAAGRRLSRSGSVDLTGALGLHSDATNGSAGAGSTTGSTGSGATASKSSDEGEEYGVVGSPQFMAPEVLEGQPYNGSVDVYSFGIVMCEIAARILPYSDRYKRFDFMDAVLEEGAVPTIPRWCGDLKRPRRRGKGVAGGPSGGSEDADSGDESWEAVDEADEEEEDESVIQPNGLPFGWKEDLEPMTALVPPPPGLLPPHPPLLAGFPLRAADIPSHLTGATAGDAPAPAPGSVPPLGGIAEWRIQRGECTGILQKLILACLDRDPDSRPSFEELVDLLRVLLDRPPHDVFMQLELPRLREALAYGDDTDASVAANEIVHFASHSLLRSIPVILSGTGVTIQAGQHGYEAGKEGSGSSGGGRSLNVKLDTSATSFFPLLPFAPLPSPSQSQMNATPYVSLDTVTQAGPELVAALIARLRHNDLFIRPRIGIPLYAPDLSLALAYGPAGTTLVVVRDQDCGVPARTAVFVRGFEHPAWTLAGAPASTASPAAPAAAGGVTTSPAVVAGGPNRAVVSAAARLASREAAIKEKEDKAKLAACIASSAQAVHALRVLLQVMGAAAPAPTSLAEDSGLEFASADEVAGHLPPASSIDRLLLKHASRLVYALSTVAVGSALSPTEHAFVTRPTGGVSLYSYRPVTPLPDLPDFGSEAISTAAALLRELWTSLPLLRTAIAHVVAVTSLAATLRYTALQVFVEPTAGGGFTVTVAEDVVQARVYGALMARLHGGPIGSGAGAGSQAMPVPAVSNSANAIQRGPATTVNATPATPVSAGTAAAASGSARRGGLTVATGARTPGPAVTTPASRGGFPVARLALGSPTAAGVVGAGPTSPAPVPTTPLAVDDLATSASPDGYTAASPLAAAPPAMHPLVAAVQTRIQGAVIERVDGLVLVGGVDIEDFDPTLV